MEAELTVAFLGFTECYTSRVTCVPYESVQVRQQKRLSLTLRFCLWVQLGFTFIFVRRIGGCSVVNPAFQDARDNVAFPTSGGRSGDLARC
jgi:hypothetical protein